MKGGFSVCNVFQLDWVAQLARWILDGYIYIYIDLFFSEDSDCITWDVPLSSNSGIHEGLGRDPRSPKDVSCHPGGDEESASWEGQLTSQHISCLRGL